jgi:hypothetical protein
MHIFVSVQTIDKQQKYRRTRVPEGERCLTN